MHWNPGIQCEGVFGDTTPCVSGEVRGGKNRRGGESWSGKWCGRGEER